MKPFLRHFFQRGTTLPPVLEASPVLSIAPCARLEATKFFTPHYIFQHRWLILPVDRLAAHRVPSCLEFCQHGLDGGHVITGTPVFQCAASFVDTIIHWLFGPETALELLKCPTDHIINLSHQASESVLNKTHFRIKYVCLVLRLYYSYYKVYIYIYICIIPIMGCHSVQFSSKWYLYAQKKKPTFMLHPIS